MSDFKRGDIVLCADSNGNFTGKPRPVVIVQSSDYIELFESVTVCPLTSILSKASVRLTLKADSINGLKSDSSIEIDKISTVRKIRLGIKVGEISAKQSFSVDNLIRNWLDL